MTFQMALSYLVRCEDTSDSHCADDEILVQLGNSTDYSDADRPRFVAGLRSLLQELRSKKIKDFKSIAAAIAAYRATFLQDNTRVLMLDDVTL